MKKDNIESLSGQTLFVGIDVHKKSFHVTLSHLLVFSWTKASSDQGFWSRVFLSELSQLCEGAVHQTHHGKIKSITNYRNRALLSAPSLLIAPARW